MYVFHNTHNTVKLHLHEKITQAFARFLFYIMDINCHWVCLLHMVWSQDSCAIIIYMAMVFTGVSQDNDNLLQSKYG